VTKEKKQAVKSALKKIGKAIWDVFPWILMWIGLTCFFSLLFISADKSVERAKQLAAIEAENAMYESENSRLEEDIDWLRSLVEQYYQEEVPNGQVQQ
jgi:hypothetical protein